MDNETAECHHVTFAHIDYTTKTLYTSWSDPVEILTETDPDIKGEHDPGADDDTLREYASNLDRLRKEGWSFVFNWAECPSEYNCANSSKEESREQRLKLLGGDYTNDNLHASQR